MNNYPFSQRRFNWRWITGYQKINNSSSLNLPFILLNSPLNIHLSLHLLSSCQLDVQIIEHTLHKCNYKNLNWYFQSDHRLFVPWIHLVFVIVILIGTRLIWIRRIGIWLRLSKCTAGWSILLKKCWDCHNLDKLKKLTGWELGVAHCGFGTEGRPGAGFNDG